MQFLPWLFFGLAAFFEISGDAIIRTGIKGQNVVLTLLGAAALGVYGLVVNSVNWDFSRIFGVYVAFFALFGVLFGKFLFQEQIQPATWFGLALIIAGGLIIQFGR